MYKEKIFDIELCAKHKFNEQMAPKTAVQGENFLVGLLYVIALKRLYDG